MEGGFYVIKEIKDLPAEQADARVVLFHFLPIAIAIQFRFQLRFQFPKSLSGFREPTPQSTPLPSTSTLPIANYYKLVPVQTAKETDLKTHLTATSLYYS